MIRVARRVTWQSRVLLLAIVVLVLEVPTLVEGMHLVGANTVMSIEVANGSAEIIVVLAIVAGSVAGVAWRRHWHMVEALRPRSGMYAMMPGIIVGVVMAATHALWFGGVLTVSDLSRDLFVSAVLPGVVACLAVVATSVLGASLGMTLNSWLVPPVSGLAAYTLLVIWNQGWQTHVMSLGGVGEEPLGVRIRPEVLATQTVWFVALGIGAAWFGWCVLQRGGARALAVAGLVAPIACLPLLQDLGDERFESVEVDWTCIGKQPEFCVVDEQAAEFVMLEPRFRGAAHRIDTYAVPATSQVYWQRLSFPAGNQVTEFSPGYLSMTDRQIVDSLLVANFPCADDWTYEQWEDIDVLVERIVGEGLMTQPQPDADPSITVPAC